MNKIILIIQREYLFRVRKKSFILLTLLTPIIFVALIFIPIWLSNSKTESIKSIVVIDEMGKYSKAFSDVENYQFSHDNKFPAENKGNEIYAFVVISDDLLINPSAIHIYSENSISERDKTIVTKQLRESLEKEKLLSYNIPNIQEIIQQSQVHLDINTILINKSTETKTIPNELSMLISIFGAFLIYMFIFMYGSQIMHSVLEEKNSRIVEIIVSSVKPTQLMIGKIIGTMLVAITQFLLWIIFILIIMFAVQLLSIGENSQMIDLQEQSFQDIKSIFFNSNWIMTIVYFIAYFFGGYLLYASFFAAIGSVIESSSDSQQFVLPIIIPLIFALFVSIHCHQNPDDTLVFWCSIIPITSPIVMVARLPFEVPIWQILTSISLLYVTFLASTYVSAKIYRTGILLYGKKTGYKEIWKWLKNKH